MKELISKVEAILSLTPEQADQIRQNARRRSLDSDYSFANRAKTVFEAFEQLCHTNNL